MSNNENLVKLHEFSPTNTNIEFSDPINNNSTFRSIGISYNKNTLNFLTHKITTPFGFSKVAYNPSNPDYQCKFNLNDIENKNSLSLQALRKLEQIVIEVAHQRRIQWNLFGNKVQAQSATLDDVRNKFTPIIHNSTGNYPPTFNASFMKKYGSNDILTTVYNDKNVLITPSEETIPKKCVVVAKIQAKNLWISPEGKFGLKFYIQSMKIYPAKTNDVNFSSSSSSSSSSPKNMVKENKKDEKDDEDDEVDEDEEVDEDDEVDEDEDDEMDKSKNIEKPNCKCFSHDYNMDILVTIAQNGHLDCLKYYHKNINVWATKFFDYAAENGHIELIKYAHKNGWKWDRHSIQFAATGGHLNCLKYLHENGCPWDEMVINNAMFNGHLDCLKYALENGCQSFDSLFMLEIARESKHANIIKYVNNKYARGGILWRR